MGGGDRGLYLMTIRDHPALAFSFTPHALGSRLSTEMRSALEQKADILWDRRHVRFVPETAIGQTHSITSSVRASSVNGIACPSASAGLRLTIKRYLLGECTGRPTSIPHLAPG